MTEARSYSYRPSVWYSRWVLWLAACAVLITAGCSSNDEKGDVTITGLVVDGDTGVPVRGAFVALLPSNDVVETDSVGRYSFTTTIDSTTVLTVQARKDGYLESFRVDVIAVAGRTIEAPQLEITRILGTEASGKASNINLVGVEPRVIGIKESGSAEVATVRFVAVDSLGRPVTIENAVTILFTLGEQPGGGEFIFPQQALTDGKGQAEVNISTGIKAGAVQIVASATVDGRTIKSLPVTIAIHGGLPDQAHFTVAPERFNFPGLRWYGVTDRISVIVGDKWSNPVKPNTSVYFSTNYGVIEGSVSTSDQGGGSVSLISANPLPPDGLAIVKAGTADDQTAAVSDSTPVVFSGPPWVRVEPDFPAVGQFYDLRVSDGNLNPLVDGTRISVTAEGKNVKAVGNTDVELDDTVILGYTYDDIVRGPGVTEFQFGVIADVPNEGENPQPPELGAIVIRVTGENGTLELVLGGLNGPTSKTDGVTIEHTPDGGVIFKLQK